MKIEKIKKDNKYKIIIGIMGILLMVSAIINVVTRAKYQTIDSIPLASGIVTYKKADLEVLAFYEEVASNSNEIADTKVSGDTTKYYKKTNTIPSSYRLNVEYSTCDNGATFGPSETTGLYVDKINTSGTKCIFYFDKTLASSLITTADKTSITTSAGFGAIETGDDQTGNAGLYEFEGIIVGSTTQFYRGAVTNNYVKLGTSGKETYWRIVRFDENGNIRLIYDGTSAHANGEVSDDRQLAYRIYNNGLDEVGVRWSNSHIKTYLEGDWLTEFKNKLSIKELKQLTTGKFCNDISVSSTSGNKKYYGARKRLETYKTPSFRCDSGEITTAEVGMLSADEYSFAGGSGWQQTNTAFYLYTGRDWWTMSPYVYVSGGGHGFYADGTGVLANQKLENAKGVRPVITLKGDTQFNSSANGTKDNPYTIV